MVPGRLSAPRVVRVHHEVARQVVAALLARPVVAEGRIESVLIISGLIFMKDTCAEKFNDGQGRPLSNPWVLQFSECCAPDFDPCGL